MTDFNKELALSLVNSEDNFPIDFEEAWQWLGFSTKASAKRKLNHFNEGIDFSTSWLKTPDGGRPSEFIRLTVDCFKSLAMMAGTEKGRETRQYFLRCEKELKYSKSTGGMNLLDKPSPQLISDAIMAVFRPTNVDPTLVSGIIANNIAKTYPALAPAMEEAKKHLTVEVEEKLLTPTELGLILEQRTGQKHSAQRVNKLLAENGLQTPNPHGKDPAWLPTLKGSGFSKLLLAAQKGVKDATRQHLQWFESVVDVLAV
jgi:hypothetical protein